MTINVARGQGRRARQILRLPLARDRVRELHFGLIPRLHGRHDQLRASPLGRLRSRVFVRARLTFIQCALQGRGLLRGGGISRLGAHVVDRAPLVDLGRRRAVGSARRALDAFDGRFDVEHFLREPFGMGARDVEHRIDGSRRRPLDLEEDLLALDRLVGDVLVLHAVEELVDSSPMLTFEDEPFLLADGTHLTEGHGRAELRPE